jgi:TPP-dependent pyruvate/acetoin dehydrogenase alpha subunit
MKSSYRQHGLALQKAWGNLPVYELACEIVGNFANPDRQFTEMMKEMKKWFPMSAQAGYQAMGEAALKRAREHLSK